jgi:[acyl-carrier-protein] S-malonyltransferase
VSVAFLFPGQGTEHVGMGLDLEARWPAAAALIAYAGRAAGVDARALLARGGRDLERTDVIQPLLVATCLAFEQVLREAGIRPAFVAGHSVGELAAWSSAGGIEATTAIDLAAVRGRLMAREAARHPGGMLALPDADEGTVAAALACGSEHGAVVLAAHNAPRQWVLTGDAPALRAIASAFPATRLPVKGAWHGPAMAGAVDELREVLRSAPTSPLRSRFVGNASGELLGDDGVADSLAAQLIRPVRWTRVLETLVRAGVTQVVTIGPGKILRALARQTLGDGVRVHTTEDAGDLERALKSLG